MARGCSRMAGSSQIKPGHDALDVIPADPSVLACITHVR
jgi:hypothetical protein